MSEINFVRLNEILIFDEQTCFIMKSEDGFNNAKEHANAVEFNPPTNLRQLIAVYLAGMSVPLLPHRGLRCEQLWQGLFNKG